MEYKTIELTTTVTIPVEDKYGIEEAINHIFQLIDGCELVSNKYNFYDTYRIYDGDYDLWNPYIKGGKRNFFNQRGYFSKFIDEENSLITVACSLLINNEQGGASNEVILKQFVVKKEDVEQFKDDFRQFAILKCFNCFKEN